MMEMGMDVPEDDLEKASGAGFSKLPREVQMAMVIFNTLTDSVEGMSGTWLGKNWTGLMDFMDIYDIEDKLECLEYLQVMNSYMIKYHSDKAKRRK